MAQPWDYIAKLVCIGDSGTGKSSLTIRLCEGRFVPQHDVTIGVEFGSRIVNVGPPSSSFPSPSSTSQITNPPSQKRMKLSLWDTAGQETYKSITRSYFRGASGALLVFDITRRSTFDAVTGWLHDLRQIAEEGIVVVLVGNKSDLCPDDDIPTSTTSTANSNSNSNGHAPTPSSSNAGPETAGLQKNNKRAVFPTEAQSWCTANNVLRYVETSAKSGAGVEAAFLEVAERIYQNIEGGKYDLNDRRSGVKGPGGGGGAGAGNRGGGREGGGGVRLGMNDTRSGGGGGGGGGGKGAMGGCC